MEIEKYSSSDYWVSKASEASNVNNGRQDKGQVRNLEKVQEDEGRNTLSEEEAKRKGIGRRVDFRV